jgi:hypothetical protein
VIDISVHQKGETTSGPVVFKMKQDQVACEQDISHKSNIKTDISHLYSCCGCSFGLGLFGNRRLSWCHGIIALLNIDLHEGEIVLKDAEMTPSEHSHTFDTGLRLPARDAGFAAALEVGFPPASGTAALEAGFAPVSVAVALEAGFTAALDGGLVAGLDAGLTAA